MTGQLEVAVHLDGLAVFVGVGGNLEGQVGHRCQERNREEQMVTNKSSGWKRSGDGFVTH